ncbi:DUF2207 domain-containing protein [Bacillus chungangensis]|uniref:Membrane protein n=1 Tax=Bacillus chungangensis TaxID=587633 RepID=A0ABT9WXF7_9BACI|nr:DUF2207 domain-containing protein [Bacillus chungangensis]MDQ0177981.1 putative membrane protein [Bacillus chungangensis]
MIPVQAIYAKSFDIDHVEIDAVLDDAGNMHIVEMDTYEFDGEFNGIIIQLGTENSDGIQDFRAVELTKQGEEVPLETERISAESDPYWEYRVYSHSEDERKTFKIYYTLKNVVSVYHDTAELYWKFFDTANDTTINKVTIRIKMPETIDREQLNVFGHGPSRGNVSIASDGTVIYTISPLREKELLEARILFPQQLVPNSLKTVNEQGKERILAEELKWAQEKKANEEMQKVQAKRAWQYTFAVIVINVLLGLLLYSRFDKEHKPQFRDQYSKEIPEDAPPAVVGYLVNRQVGISDMIATLFDLVRRKYVHIEPIPKRTDYVFYLNNKNSRELLLHEQMLLDWLFFQPGSEDGVRLSDVIRAAENPCSAKKYLTFFQHWNKTVKKIGEERGYFERSFKIGGPILLFSLVQMIVIFTFVPGWGKFSVLFPIILAIYSLSMSRRTPESSTLYAKWMALKRYLEATFSYDKQGFGKWGNKQSLYPEDYEKYVVYGIALGVADDVIEAMKTSVHYQQSMLYYHRNYPLFYYCTYHDRLYHTISRGFRRTNSIASTTVEKETTASTGQGGSFSSGGGGGGGGGGGRGAF